ncbi:uncharacterized protein [Aristolochia californica]|uniref:uncharacterized protein n=1 Tax=Aristolochia californica TaxID=171875 RepID=UPI0035E36D1D
MTKQIVIREAPMVIRRQSLLPRRSQSTCSKIAETAGVTAAECAAVCCCCPCGLLDLVVTTFVKLPGGLCYRAIRNSRRKKRAKKLGHLSLKQLEVEDPIYPINDIIPWSPERSPSVIVFEVEKEMWSKFYNNGFWRSISERERPEQL